MTADGPAADMPTVAEGRTPRKQFRPTLIVLATCLGIVSLCLAGLWLTFGSIPVGLRYLRGERLIVQPSDLYVARLTETEAAPVVTRIHNFTTGSVRLLGMTAPCTCVMVEALPVTVRGGESCDLTFYVRALPSKRVVNESIIIYTDDPRRPHLDLRIQGAVHF